MANQTKLRELQIEAGARFDEEAGSVVSFGDGAAEVHAARTGCALFDLSGTAVVEFRGRDAADYLHRMLTNSVKSLQPGQGARGTVLQGDGRMVADLTVHRISTDNFLLVTPGACRLSVVNHLDRYLITEQMEIADQTDSLAVLEVTGPQASRALASVLEMETADMILGNVRETELKGNHIAVIRTDAVGLPGFLVLCPAPSGPLLWTALTTGGALPAGTAARSVLRVEAGIPEFGRDMNETTIPLEANLKDAIDFRKGCFPGQEIVARIENLGHPAKLLVGLKLDSGASAAAGTLLFLGQKNVGRVTSVAESSAVGGTIALGYVKWDQREAGTELSLGSADSGLRAVVHEIPFVK